MLNPKDVPEGTTHYCPGSCMPFEKYQGGRWYAWDDETNKWWMQGFSANARPAGTGEDLEPAPIELFLGAA